MRKLISVLHIMFDGVMSGPQGDEDNMVAMPGITDSIADVQASFQEFDTILLGRITYDGLSQFWPFQSGEFADLMNKTPKIVLSRTLNKVQWGDFDNISVINKDVKEEVKNLKERNGRDMIISASANLLQNFTNDDLIDEYRIVVHPILLGSGKRVFDHINARKDLKLESIKPYPSGAVLFRYTLTNH